MAAGKGTRLATDGIALPKVLREANGRPLISYVLDSVSGIEKKDTVIVTGYMAEKVEESFPTYTCVRQGDDAYGTGYAVMCAMKSEALRDYHGYIAVLNGDMPLVRKSTVDKMCEMAIKNAPGCVILGCESDTYLPYGRIIRDGNGDLVDIVEENECTEEQKKIKALNVGTYVFDADCLRTALAGLKNDNNKHEYYLTDVPPAIARSGNRTEVFMTSDQTEMWGVNTPDDLKTVGRLLNERKNA